jgi:indolepyruvate ferredoxin oxidoreductase
VVWPLEAQLTREFATGLQEILVVEEKRQVIEYQLKEGLYNWRSDVRPRVLGKFNEAESDASGFGSGGEWGMANPHANTLLRANADLSPAIIARAIAKRIKLMGVDADIAARIDAQLAILNAKESAMQVLEVNRAKAEIKLGDRQPWFCSGCPHNTSTKVPDGSRAMAGIGCHFMTSGWTDPPWALPRWAARACHGLASSPSATTSTCSPTWAMAPTSTAACWPCARALQPASTLPTRFCTTTRSP